MPRNYDSFSDLDDDFDQGDEEEDYYDGEDDDLDFAEPGGRSSLRAATREDPRDQPCPTCEAPNRLTRRDVGLGYQCDRCADRAELGGDF